MLILSNDAKSRGVKSTIEIPYGHYAVQTRKAACIAGHAVTRLPSGKHMHRQRVMIKR